MSWPINDYSINSIYLDTENIRQPITDTAQDAILQDLFSNEDAFDIVKSKEGQLEGLIKQANG